MPRAALLFLATQAAASAAVSGAGGAADWRALAEGRLMLQDLYLDQPQCAIWPGPPRRWVCTIARNSAPEGHFGEHAEVLFTEDQGLTWVTGIRLEPPGAPTNSYGNILVTPFGRLAVVYSMNLRNVTRFPSGQPFTRDDELGFMVWRFSDDGARTWSPDRYVVPLRNTSIDRHNTFNGSTQIFWSVDRITATRQGGSLHAFTKIGTYMQSAPEESFFVLSPNLLSERNASAVAWRMLPEGDTGVQPPGGAASGMQWEEAHVVQLAGQQGMFSVCRTSAGYLGAAGTRDDSGARGWGAGHFATYSAAGLPAAAGRRVKNPEGPITLRRLASGRYLLLFYNNAVRGYANATLGRNARNPYWLAAGWEEPDGEVRFSQPEVALHDARDAAASGGAGPGYADLIEEEDGAVFITETNKTQARLHPVPAPFLRTLLAQDALNATPSAGLALPFPRGAQGATLRAPPLPSFELAGGGASARGATLCLWLALHARAAPGQALIDVGGPLRLGVGAGGALEVALAEGAALNASLRMDDECAARLAGGGAHLAAAVLDGAAHILSFSVDGVVCDGGAGAAFGFVWAPQGMGDLQAVPHSATFVLAGGYGGQVLGGGWYTRALMHSELVGSWRAGPPA